MNGARTNIAYNCLERHIEAGHGERIAYYWEGNEPGDTATITYAELLKKVTDLAALLRSKGIRKGDVSQINISH